MNEHELITRGVSEIIDAQNLSKRLKEGGSLRVKFGIDPTGADLHLGHTVNLWKLRQFQELGHTAVLVIGDYTASIGDPSGKNKTRPTLSEKEIKENYREYERQVRRILLKKNFEVRYQSEWYKKFSLKDVIALMSSTSVGQVLSHETFRNRLEKEEPFSAHEFLYPFLQGYDSVAVKADVELGATEQKFNLLMGRTVQRAFGVQPQDVMMSPYLLGTDGVEKMSKSLGNYVGLRDEPQEMFGKVMSIRDEEIIPYFEMATPMPLSQIEQIKSEGIQGATARDAKVRLARTIVAVYHGEDVAAEAERMFLSVFGEGNVAEGATQVTLSSQERTLVDLLVEVGLAASKSEARRHVEAGAVYIDETKKSDPFERITLADNTIVRVGKRNVVRLHVA